VMEPGAREPGKEEPGSILGGFMPGGLQSCTRVLYMSGLSLIR
jgi:hypothetical protein